MFSNCLNWKKLAMFNCLGENFNICSPGLISLQIVNKYPDKCFMIKAPQLKYYRLDIVNSERLRIDYCPEPFDLYDIYRCTSITSSLVQHR